MIHPNVRIARMYDVGWGRVNQSVQTEAKRLLLACRSTPSSLIKEAMQLSTSPSPAVVADRLTKAGVDFVIIGAHALGVYTKEPRATKDVDVVVDNVEKAVQALKAIQPRTKLIDLGKEVGMRIADSKGKELVDVLVSTGNVRGELFSNRIKVMLFGKPAFIPTLPAMLALKWLAMFSPTPGSLKQLQDKADFLRIIETNPKANIEAAAKMVSRANKTLAAQLLYDMKEYKKTGNIKLFGESS